MLHGSILPVLCVPPVTSECPVSSGRSPLRASSEFPLGSTISGEIADFRDFLQLLAGRRFLRTVRHLEMARFPPSLFSQLAGFRSSLFSSVGPPHWIQTNWILLVWWLRYLVLGL